MKKPWVIKAGGELMSSLPTRGKILNDLANWSQIQPVIFVHGGGPQIEAELSRSKVAAKFQNGRRVTSVEAMVIVERVLSGEINKSIVSELVLKKIKAVGLSGRDAGLLTAEPLPNLGRAGRPIRVDTSLLLDLIRRGYLPVLSSVASDKRGLAMNVNADDFASAIACSLKASNLVYLTDIAGVQDKYKKRIPTLKINMIDSLVDDKTIHGGMIPKVQSARNAILQGVREINIVDGFQGINLEFGTKICR